MFEAAGHPTKYGSRTLKASNLLICLKILGFGGRFGGALEVVALGDQLRLNELHRLRGREVLELAHGPQRAREVLGGDGADLADQPLLHAHQEGGAGEVAGRGQAPEGGAEVLRVQSLHARLYFRRDAGEGGVAQLVLELVEAPQRRDQLLEACANRLVMHVIKPFGLHVIRKTVPGRHLLGSPCDLYGIATGWPI
eukprot:1189743-Prorocentrum_minimum.AAC.3